MGGEAGGIGTVTKLTTLTLSNIRRFGPEVTIDFSPGATVLLAPNGTGKTAVFESIELALTGSVARLQNDLTPLIRDGNDQAQVRLLLEENERVVQIDRNRPIQIHGTLEGVFGNTDQADLPFLLRLTHLLDQRERDWFVHAEAKAAGSQLAKLPIGRDGTQANSVLGSARRYLSDQLNQATERVNQAASELDEWHHLLREAVSMVAIHLTADRQDCPVCGVHHGAEELRQRVHESLSAIDPLLGAAERELQDAAEGLKRSEALVSDTRAALQLARTALSRAEGQRAALAAETDAIRANRLVAADTVASARQAIGDRAAQLSTAQRALSDELSAAPIPVPLDEFSQAKAALDVASQRLEGARLAAAEARVQLDHATRVYASARSGAEASASLQELSTAQLDIDRDLAALQAAYNSDSETLLRQQGQLSELESRAVEIEQQVAHAQSRLASIQTSWKQLSLPGEPSAEVAVAVEAQLTSEREVLERQSTQVEAIETEIVRWQKAEQNRLAESMLERRRGGTSESEVTAQLSKRVDDGMASVGHLAQMSRALEALSGRLSTEIGNIHDHVVAVVPLWRSLLKRIVRDQRFAQTDLDFYSHYKKEHASVLVPLHGTSVPVPSIASEAQMTDLQLTFLLSMAVRHHWCSWRALLLDDPTQHHDLVHAASVFDVLRDYIVDQGFQIVVATHDALQARFLMRKLQNDGIPSRLWTLTPTAKGVTAIAGK